MTDKLADYGWDLLKEARSAQDRLEQAKERQAAIDEQFAAQQDANAPVGIEGLSGGEEPEKPLLSYNDMLNLQMNGQVIDWEKVVPPAGQSDVGAFPESVYDPSTQDVERMGIKEYGEFVRLVGREAASRYLNTAKGIESAMISSAAGMQVTNPYAPDFSEVTDDTDIFNLQSVIDDISITEKEWQDMSAGERVSVGVGALLLELPKYAAFMRAAPGGGLARETGAVDAAGNVVMQHNAWLLKQMTRMGLDPKKAMKLLETGAIWMEQPLAEGIAFGNLGLVEMSGNVDLMIQHAAQQDESLLREAAKQYAWSVATGVALGVGGNVAGALRLPYGVHPVPGAAGMAGIVAAQGGSNEEVIKAFTEMYALGLIHPARAQRFSQYARETANIIGNMELRKEKSRKRDVDIEKEAFEAAKKSGQEQGVVEPATEEKVAGQTKVDATLATLKETAEKLGVTAKGEKVPPEKQTQYRRGEIEPPEQGATAEEKATLLDLIDEVIEQVEEAEKQKKEAKPKEAVPEKKVEEKPKEEAPEKKAEAKPKEEAKPEDTTEGEELDAIQKGKKVAEQFLDELDQKYKEGLKLTEADLAAKKYFQQQIKDFDRLTKELEDKGVKPVAPKEEPKEKTKVELLEEERAKLATERDNLKANEKLSAKQKARLKEVKDRIRQIAQEKRSIRKAGKAEQEAVLKQAQKQQGKPKKDETKRLPELVETEKVLSKKEGAAKKKSERPERRGSTKDAEAKLKDKAAKAGKKKTRAKSAKRQAEAAKGARQAIDKALETGELARIILRPDKDTKRATQFEELEALFASLRTRKQRVRFLDDFMVETENGRDFIYRGKKKEINYWHKKVRGVKKLPKRDTRKILAQRIAEKVGIEIPVDEKFVDRPEGGGPVARGTKEYDVFFFLAKVIGTEQKVPEAFLKDVYEKELGKPVPDGGLEAVAKDVAIALGREGIYVRQLDQTITPKANVKKVEGELIEELGQIKGPTEEELRSEEELASTIRGEIPTEEELTKALDTSAKPDKQVKLSEGETKTLKFSMDNLGLTEGPNKVKANDNAGQVGWKIWERVIERYKKKNQAALESLRPSDPYDFEPSLTRDIPEGKLHADVFTEELFGYGKADWSRVVIRNARDLANLGNVWKAPYEMSNIVLADDKGNVIDVISSTSYDSIRTEFWAPSDEYSIKKASHKGHERYYIEYKEGELPKRAGDIIFADDGAALMSNQTRFFKTKDEAQAYWDQTAKAFLGKPKNERMVRWINKAMQERGATKFYLQHNHPFNPPIASRGDVMFLFDFIERANAVRPDMLKGFGGFIVTNHEIYSVVDLQSALRLSQFVHVAVSRGMKIPTIAGLVEDIIAMDMTRAVPVQGRGQPNPYLPSVPHEYLYEKIHTAWDLAQAGKYTEISSENNSLVMFTKNDGTLTRIEEYPNKFFTSTEEQLFALLANRGRRASAVNSFIWTTSEEVMKSPIVNTILADIDSNLRDVVLADGEWVTDGLSPFSPKWFDASGEAKVSMAGVHLGARSRAPKGPTRPIRHEGPIFVKELAREVGDQPAYYYEGREQPIRDPDYDIWRRSEKDVPKASRQAEIQDLGKYVPTYFGKGSKMGTWHYKRGPNVIRLKNRTSLEDAFKAHGMAIFDMMVQGYDANGKLIRGFPNTLSKEVRNLAVGSRPNIVSATRSGFSEWFHRFIVDPAEAERVAPELNATMARLMLLNENAEIKNSIIQARMAWNRVNTKNPIRWTQSFIRNRTDVETRAEAEQSRATLRGDLITSMKDNLYYLWNLRDDLKKTGFTVNPSEDFALNAALARGSHGRAFQFLVNGQFQFSNTSKTGTVDVGRGLAQILHPVDYMGQTESFSNYLFVKRVANDKTLLKGYQKADPGVDAELYFKESVRLYENEYPHFREVRAELDNYTHQLLVYLKDSGFIGKEDIERMEKSNAFYIPLYTVAEDTYRFTGSERVRVQKSANLFSPLKRKTGRAGEIYDPIESLIFNTMSMISTADANRTGVALYRQWQRARNENTLAAETLGHIFDVVGPDMKKVTITKDEMVRELKQLGLSPEEIAALDVKDFEIFRPSRRLGKKELRIRVDGEEKILQFKDSKGKGLSVYKAMKGMDPMQLNGVMKMLQKVTQFHRTSATAISYKFGVRNPFRDQIMALIQSKFNLTDPMWFVDGMAGLIDSVTEGGVWNDFHRSGAGMSTMLNITGKFDHDTFLRFSRKGDTKLRRAGQTLTSGEYYLLNPIAWVGQKGEMVARLGEFKRSMRLLGEVIGADKNEVGEFIAEQTRASKQIQEMAARQGWDLDKFTPLDVLMYSGYAGREVTLDFGRIGKDARHLNTIISFWNANLEASSKLLRLYKENPVRASMRAFVGITLPSLANWWYNKDDPNYTDLPLWRRTIMWNQPIYWNGEHIFTLSIPKPWTLGIAYGSLPEMLADTTYRGKEGEHVDGEAMVRMNKVFEQIFTSIMPGQAVKVGPVYLPAPIPTAAMPMVEWWSNKSFFYNRPLVPEDRLELAEWQQYNPWTSETMKQLGKYMSKVPGFKKTASPAKLENFVRGYTTGIGELLLRGTDAGLAAFDLSDSPTPPSSKLSDLPILDALSSRWPSPRTYPMEIFYELYTKHNKKRNTHFEEIGLRGNLRQLSPLIGIDGKYWTMRDESVYQNMLHTHHLLDLLRDVSQSVWDDDKLDKNHKRELLDANYYLMNNVARLGLGKAEAISAQWQGKTELTEIWRRASDIKTGSAPIEIKRRQ